MLLQVLGYILLNIDFKVDRKAEEDRQGLRPVKTEKPLYHRQRKQSDGETE